MNQVLTYRRAWLAILTILTAGFIFFVNRALPRAAALPVYGKIGDFQLVERSGQTITLDGLKGKVWIADFIFTRCGGICPMMSSKMRQLQTEFSNQPEIRFVSFTVDPDRDSPEVLSNYSEHFNADPQKWFFLTGDKAQLFSLSQQHFHLGVSDIAPENRQAPDQSVDHSSKFALVDRQSVVRGYYSSEEAASMNRLVKDAKRLLEEKI